jgi:hypothetical protein
MTWSRSRARGDRPDLAENAAIGTAHAAATGLPTVAEIQAWHRRAWRATRCREPIPAPVSRAVRNLYRELAPFARPWAARFVCSLAFVRTPRGDIAFAQEATVEGEIAESPRGTNGFGYDPIFFYPPYGRTLGEVDADRKLAVAHRGKAFRMFRDWLGA